MERENLVKTDDMCRLQLVLYREKVVLRITDLVEAIKSFEEETVRDVSSICRTMCLAQLQNSMPGPKVWRGIGRIPHEPQDYVYEYIGTVLEPVLDAVTRLGVQLQKRAGSTILKVVCYSWLEHVKAQKIKFSLWGAQQLLKGLLRNFHALAEWLRNYPGLDPEARTQILAVDVLRECEGVARLLMRQPPLVVGYTSQNQVAPLGPISAGRKHDKEVRLSSEDDDIPAEMYVPNQQLWLNLRARSSTALCVKFASCCSWPY
ncbi:Coiled-coil domain-containing protein [Armadillidium nasatum]|uniref:Coiled-coil domain-containing protein n=1 Tax=Armadillidium nasatum TaxID=96803 RepID=A0A5N5T1S1_9CRUS|nr:Coiled-coil domain-containing protein [Armadillidium nasatum]